MRLSALLPSFIYEPIQRMRKRVLYWEGDYLSWEAASLKSQGYDDHAILDKTAEAVQAVLRGEAAFERDSVAFDKVEINHAIADPLLEIARDRVGSLSVCDFGGSLGSTYLQHRDYFAGQAIVWSVIEQAHYIAYAQQHIEVEHLHFYPDLSTFAADQKPHVLVLSSVLSYLPAPWEMLDEMLRLDFEYILIDKTPIHPGARTRLTVQHLPKSINDASYPCWFLSEIKLMDKLKEYELISEYETPMHCNLGLPHKGYFLKRK